MLNWDEYGKEENSTPPVAPEVKNDATAKKAEAQHQNLLSQLIQQYQLTHQILVKDLEQLQQEKLLII